MKRYIDLRKILADPAATEILLLARGQLNRAFRQRGLVPPDSLIVSNSTSADTMELDDPAALGIEEALAKFQEDFLAWAGAMPAELGPPVLNILQQALEALSLSPENPDGPRAALTAAYEFLSEFSAPDRNSRPTA
jgi:hypothetical protein